MLYGAALSGSLPVGWLEGDSIWRELCMTTFEAGTVDEVGTLEPSG